MKRLPSYLFLVGLSATLNLVSQAQNQPVGHSSTILGQDVQTGASDTVGSIKVDTTINVNIQGTLIDPQILDSLRATIDTAMAPTEATVVPVNGESDDHTDTDPVFIRKTSLLKNPLIRNDAFTLTGQVIDGTTGETAPYASVRVDKLGLGTVSNIDGNWTLRLPAAAANEQLTVKYLGYGTQTLSISRLPDKSLVCLEPSAFELRQV
ncbi:MAG: carboxypeptidase-like regulatory domain-containing protein, partial [Bacteroidales bacterium]|nr:carboxypeptidase-like regulatory domain-containing protein [Bacteroidales bacterium]